MAPHDPVVRRFGKGALEAVEQFFFAMIERGKATGELPASLAPRSTAQALLGLFLGVRVLSRSGADKAALDAITVQAKVLLA